MKERYFPKPKIRNKILFSDPSNAPRNTEFLVTESKRFAGLDMYSDIKNFWRKHFSFLFIMSKF